MKNNIPILISFSGGRTSAFMAKFIKESPLYKDREKVYVFANTGKELENTLKFVQKCDKEWNLNIVWIEGVVNPERNKGTTFKIVDYETASRNGEPFEDVIKKYGIPSVKFPHCTRELKQSPIYKYMSSRFDNWETAIGIRADEPNRLGNAHDRLKNPIYPLANTIKVDEKFIRDWWSRQSFDLELKHYESNCDLCYKKSKRVKLTLLSDYPNISEWWSDMEKKYGGEKYRFDLREYLSIFDLLELSKKPFRREFDSKELRQKQLELFDPNMDVSYNCMCS